jgi:hypothetical protein
MKSIKKRLTLFPLVFLGEDFALGIDGVTIIVEA